jgi:hypothetical protein
MRIWRSCVDNFADETGHCPACRVGWAAAHGQPKPDLSLIQDDALDGPPPALLAALRAHDEQLGLGPP